MDTSLSAAVVDKEFPEGTVDPGFTFTITGTLADGTSFSTSASDTVPSHPFTLEPGTYVGTVSKLGFASQPSTPFIVSVPGTITLSVPDETQAALFS